MYVLCFDKAHPLSLRLYLRTYIPYILFFYSLGETKSDLWARCKSWSAKEATNDASLAVLFEHIQLLNAAWREDQGEIVVASKDLQEVFKRVRHAERVVKNAQKLVDRTRSAVLEAKQKKSERQNLESRERQAANAEATLRSAADQLRHTRHYGIQFGLKDYATRLADYHARGAAAACAMARLAEIMPPLEERRDVDSAISADTGGGGGGGSSSRSTAAAAHRAQDDESGYIVRQACAEIDSTSFGRFGRFGRSMGDDGGGGAGGGRGGGGGDSSTVSADLRNPFSPPSLSSTAATAATISSADAPPPYSSVVDVSAQGFDEEPPF